MPRLFIFSKKFIMKKTLNITEKILAKKKAEKILRQAIKDEHDSSLLSELKEDEKEYFPNRAKSKEIGINITSTYSYTGTTISPNALPVNLQNYYNIYLIGSADYKGNFSLANQIINQFGWSFLSNTIDSYGNLIITFQDSSTNYQLKITYSCTKIPYVDFLEYLISEHYYLSTLKYISPDVNQYKNPLLFTKQNLFGNNKTVTLDPLTFKTSDAFQQQIVLLNTQLNINQKHLICTNVNYTVQSLSFILALSEVY